MALSIAADQSVMRVLTRTRTWWTLLYITGFKPLLNFGSNPDPESGFGVRIRTRTPDPDHILLGGRMPPLTAIVKHCENFVCSLD